MFVNSLRAAVAASLMLAAGAANAEVRTFEFTGTINYSVDPTVPLGTKLHGRFSYDDTTPNYSPTAGVGLYESYTFMSGDYLGHLVETAHVSIGVYNDFGHAWDTVTIVGGYPLMLDDEVMTDGTFSIMLTTRPKVTNVVNDVRLPTSYNVADWSPTLSYGQLRRDGSEPGTILQYSIDSIVAVDACLKQNGDAAKKNCH
jgi:hypothetical protein